MRAIFTFSVLTLVFCVGCPPTATEPEKDKPADSVETSDFDNPAPLVEPMYPKQREEDTPDEAPADESAVPETTGVTALTHGKYAGEVVPLPPLEDLTAQIDEYMTSIASSLEYLDGSTKYERDAADIVRDANALALVAFALGLAEGDSKYKPSASPIIAAAKTLAAAQNLDEGNKAYDALKASLIGRGNGKSLSWTEKVADLAPVMKALPNLSSAVKRVTDTERKIGLLSESKAKQVYGQLATMAVIAQGSIPNVMETTKPNATAEWKKYCEEFRDAAIKANAAARQYAQDKADGKEPNYATFSTSFKSMTESCDDCHKEFFPKAIGQK